LIIREAGGGNGPGVWINASDLAVLCVRAVFWLQMPDIEDPTGETPPRGRRRRRKEPEEVDDRNARQQKRMVWHSSPPPPAPLCIPHPPTLSRKGHAIACRSTVSSVLVTR